MTLPRDPLEDLSNELEDASRNPNVGLETLFDLCAMLGQQLSVLPDDRKQSMCIELRTKAKKMTDQGHAVGALLFNSLVSEIETYGASRNPM